MTKKKAVSAPVRRRMFTAEFKLEMVRQFAAWRAQGVSQAQIARARSECADAPTEGPHARASA